MSGSSDKGSIQGSDSNERPLKNWDKKSIGAGGAAVFAVLTVLQGQGITLMNASQEEKNAAIIQKTVINELKNQTQDQRIDQLEKSLNNLEQQIRAGFDQSRLDLRSEIEKLSEILRVMTADRYTKGEHLSFAESVSGRIQRLEDDIRRLERESKNSTK